MNIYSDPNTPYVGFATIRAENGDYDEICLGNFDDGWYWWYCMPGYLPSSESPAGPFESEKGAVDDARSLYDENLTDENLFDI